MPLIAYSNGFLNTLIKSRLNAGIISNRMPAPIMILSKARENSSPAISRASSTRELYRGRNNGGSTMVKGEQQRNPLYYLIILTDE